MPHEIGNLKWLENLKIGALAGTLPTELSLLTNLTLLLLIMPDVIEPLPDLGSLSQLKDLQLHNSQFLKSIPQWVWRLPLLVNLALSGGFDDTSIDDLIRLENLESLSISGSRITASLPSKIDRLADSLQIIRLYDTPMTGSLPETIGKLKKLSELIISGIPFTGTIPNSISTCAELKTWFLSRTTIAGNLPNDLGNLTHLTTLIMENNPLLAGPIPDSFGKLQSLQRAELRSNSFSGALPLNMSGLVSLVSLDLSNNMLEGTIPTSLLTLGNVQSRVSLILSHNLFHEIPSSGNKFYSLKLFDASYNRLNGTLPYLFIMTTAIKVDHNAMVGEFGQLDLATEIDFSHNLFTSWGDFFVARPSEGYSFNFGYNRFNGSFASRDTFLDATVAIFTNNSLTGTIPIPDFFTRRIGGFRRYDLSFNQLSGTLPRFWIDQARLDVDLSHNQFTGTIPNNYAKNIENLNLAYNNLEGSLSQLAGGPVQTLNIASNKFNFHASAIALMPSLLNMNARNNNIYGSFMIDHLKVLQYMDLSRNNLNDSFDLQQIAKSFHTSLRFLSIADNPSIPPINSLVPGVTVSKVSSHQLPNSSTTVCYSIDVHSEFTAIFEYDDALFDYLQCNCTTGHYGIAPELCFPCPLGLECFTSFLNLSESYFITSQPSYIQNGRKTTRPCDSPFIVEACQVGALAGLTSCKGGLININPTFSVSDEVQCTQGSNGRLCSHCKCHVDRMSGSKLLEDDKKCYFARGPTCVACSSLWTNSQFWLLASLVVLVSYIALVIVMYSVIQSRRSNDRKRWEDLSIPRRMIHRLKHFASLGLLSIAISFGQIYSEVTEYDSYALRAYLKIVNGEVEGLGLVCIAPFTRTPLGRLLGRLLLPLVCLIILTCSIYTADLIFRLLQRYQRLQNARRFQFEPHQSSVESRHTSAHSSENTTEESGDDMPEEAHRLLSIHSWNDELEIEVVNLDNQDSVRPIIHYPATALVSNIGISVLRFFYFSVALGATEYFFWTVQQCTGAFFVQSHPWMLYSEAKLLRRVSIPFLILYVAGLPVLFGFVLLKFRKEISSSRLELYLGSIISKFRVYSCWWELALVARKLSLALILRGLANSSSLHGGLVLFILVSHLVAHVIMMPWKVKIDNTMDLLGAALLILSQAAAQSGVERKTFSDPWQYSMLALVAIFFVVIVVMIIYQTITSKTEYQINWEAHHAHLLNPSDVKPQKEEMDEALHVTVTPGLETSEDPLSTTKPVQSY
jgi:Leucine-rich repeat (LRR) protein